jgi:drug/metabolite transporter (DMT)-like permease
VPVIGIVASWLQLGERPGGIEGAGMILIVSALLVTVAAEILLGRRRRRSSS